MIILSDEIYGELHHAGVHVSIARFYPEGTIISSGLSKWCGAGGWRLGTFVFPSELSAVQKTMTSVASETFPCVNTPVQYAAVKAFEGGEEIEGYLKHVRSILSTISLKAVGMLTGAGISVNNPAGAFYLFIDFSRFREKLMSQNIFNSSELCKQLLEDSGVALLPGSNFGRPQEELTARLSYVNFDGKTVLEASKKMGLNVDLPDDFVENFCGEILEGIQVIMDNITK